MSDNVPTVSGEVSASATVLPVRLHVSSDEEDKEEDEESGHDDGLHARRISGDIPLQHPLTHVPDAHILMNVAHLHKEETCEVQ